ncbi:hypothetical protein IMZ48_42355 [Candidatus Bathyarchaeota archaeon]|nr:hypothetical protein [Candidatus Bathyarchaeota archaeon]
MASPPAAPSILQTAISPSDRGARERTPSPDTEAPEPSAQAAADSDVEMVSPAIESFIPQPPASPSAEAPAQTREAEELDEIEVVPTKPAPEYLDEVQADIQKQLEDSIVMESEGPGAPAAGADQQPHESDGQQHDEAEAGKGTSRALGAEALASPPLTQAAQSQVDAEDVTLEEVTSTAGHPEAEHLPTPGATQLTSVTQSFEEAITTVEHGDSTEVSKVTLGSPTMEPEEPEVQATPKRARRDVASPATKSSTMKTAELSTHAAPPSSAEGFAITVKSLRDRQHSSGSSEKKDASRRDPSTQPARSSLAARRSAAAEGTPQTSGRELRSKTRSVRLSASPEPQLRSPELGEAVEPENKSQGILKLQLNKNSRLNLLDLTSLKVLRSNINKKVDVLGVATAQPPSPQRPKNGPRDYLLNLTMTDQTTAPNGVVAVQVFRPHIEFLPVVGEGDVVLLRRFAVTALRGRGFGLRSCDESSWAVWERDAAGEPPQIKGPPPEVSAEEGSQAGLLLRWYAGLDGRAREKLGRANAKLGQE